MKTDKFIKTILHFLKKAAIDAKKKGKNPEKAVKKLAEEIKSKGTDGFVSLFLIWSLKEIFESSSKINADKWRITEQNEKFQKEIKALGKNIPSLNVKDDVFFFESPDSKIICDDSKWLHSQSEKVQNEIQEGILIILKKFNLPYSFYDKIEKYILYPKYRKKIPVPLSNVFEWSPFDTNRCLTSKEKKILKMVLKEKFGVKNGRPPKNKKEALKLKIKKQKINKIMDYVLKNRKRRKRKLERDFRIRDEMRKRKEKKEVETAYTGYLRYIERENKAGRMSKQEFERLKKIHPHQIKKHISRYTSKKIAAKILGDKNKDATIRQAFRRICKEIKKSEK